MQVNFPKLDRKILKFWKKNNIFEKLRKKNQGKKHWSFLDGPITANNPMGVHHAWGRTYKDLFQRYKAMQGFDQRFQNGFDCQGLWVEVEVEKELGFRNKKDIEKYGIEKFVNKCKERVRKYSKIQTKQSIRLGQWMNWKNSYYTMSDENNYAIWYFLKKCHEKGLLYKGRDVVPWCWRCGTAISQHEILTEEYKEISHKAIFFKLPIIGRKKTFFLVWTTTPWTLPANVAIAVHPDFQYAQVKDKKGNFYLLLKRKANLIPQGKIVKTFKGNVLKGLKYQGLFDELPAVKEALLNYQHSVITWEDVSSEEGTGIVHIAPGCGQEDFQLAKKFKFSIIDPTNKESIYKKGFGFLSRKPVIAVNDLIFKNLNKKGLIFKIEDYLHRYPTCWRCKSELIFRLVDEWHIAMDKLRKPLVGVVKKITWIPPFGLERELDWLKNMQDWLISKKRYWGLVLPIFECPCGNFEVIGSKEELRKRAVEGWKEFKNHSPHRPWIDKVKIKCSKCGKKITRIPDVGNPWLDAGIVPFSTMGYFVKQIKLPGGSYVSGKDYWEKWFPTEFVCESFPGQFKNWFYAIIVMSTVLEGVPPTKTIFGYASVRDEKGEEMHKSKGNVIWFDEAIEKIGADPMRWIYARQNSVYDLRFGFRIGEEIKKKLLILYNVFFFFISYVGKKDVPNSLKTDSKNILDRWILSKLNNLILKVTTGLDKYEPSITTLAIEDFFINDLSLWYLRRSRERFHIDDQHKKEVIKTLYSILITLTKIIAPIIPFFAEEMYQQMRKNNMPESIHFCDWPKVNKKMIDKTLEEKMKIVREIVNRALAQRAKAGIKVRQPLSSLKVKNYKSEIEGDEDLIGLIKKEVNVREIVFDNKIKKEVKIDTKISDELKKEGSDREQIRNVNLLRKKFGLIPKDIVDEIVSTFSVYDLKNFLEKTKAKGFKKVQEESEMDVNIKKEIKIARERGYIGIKR